MFIKKVQNWVEQRCGKWSKKRDGLLTNETATAIIHARAENNKFQYVLLGKFQTDNIEFRFSQYRKMSGSYYHVSVPQILESEKNW